MKTPHPFFAPRPTLMGWQTPLFFIKGERIVPLKVVNFTIKNSPIFSMTLKSPVTKTLQETLINSFYNNEEFILYSPAIGAIETTIHEIHVSNIDSGVIEFDFEMLGQFKNTSLEINIDPKSEQAMIKTEQVLMFDRVMITDAFVPVGTDFIVNELKFNLYTNSNFIDGTVKFQMTGEKSIKWLSDELKNREIISNRDFLICIENTLKIPVGEVGWEFDKVILTTGRFEPIFKFWIHKKSIRTETKFVTITQKEEN